MDLQTPSDREADRRRSADDLRRARALDASARRSARWYARYLFAFALASFVMAALFGVVGSFWGSAVLTPLWLVFLTGLTVYSTRQPTVVRGMGRLHGLTIAGWAVAWGVTVTVGTRYYPEQLWWWVLGGLAMATPPLLAARVVEARTAEPGHEPA